jgi:transcriptional regulator with XRE-family HTH domain
MTTETVNLADPAAYAGLMAGPRKKEPPKIDFPQRLSALRKERNLTQQALSEMVGMGITQIKRYEAGTSQPTLDAIRNLARTLRVSADELLFGTTERGPDEDLRFQFEAIQRFSNEEKKVVRSVLEGLLLTHEARRWNSSGD